ncbi:MAG: YfcE family phosphodiesterase [Desulfovibrionaceae bacterium]|jgi:putative phosphoesterase|nr:YfcE family phosphodiesterase [Desulfovibrionaceae bacterium]
MLIAVVSDSHLSDPAPGLQRVFDEHLAGADHLVHCGDITSVSAWHFFLQHPNLHAVHGNMCDWNLAAQLPERLSLRLGPLNVGVVHGWGPRGSVGVRACESFGPGYDLVCYGHTHDYDWRMCGATRLLNPGSFRAGSLALLDVDGDGTMRVRRVEF